MTKTKQSRNLYLVSAILFFGIGILFWKISFDRSSSAPLFDTDANNEFLSVIGDIDNINDGILVYLQPTYSAKANDSLKPYYVVVLNQSDEPIKFSNNGFGIQIFSFDQVENSWTSVEMSAKPGNIPLIVPVQRFWTLRNGDFHHPN
jgi:hypothetical protein